MNSPRPAPDPIPFNRVWVPEGALLEQSLRSGRLSGDQAFTARCRQWLERELGVSNVLLTTSCTHALELAALLLRIGPGDEVILPSFTFVSTANAFVLRGATPVFADVRPDTLNLDERQLDALITPRTRAIVPVHYNGVACDLDAIAAAAERIGASVIEDNAHGLFGAYHGRLLGTSGRLGAVSFHESKMYTCGEGGALLVNDPALAERAEILREKGTDRTRFFRGQTAQYTWLDAGSSYLPADLLAALLWSQFEQRAALESRREALWRRYHAELESWARAEGVRQPACPPGCTQPYYMYYLLLPTRETRDRFLRELKGAGIQSTFHYLPLHLSPMGRACARPQPACPVTEQVSGQIARLPLFPDLTPADQDRVLEAVTRFVC